MPLISVTRLRIRSAWYLPAFFFYTLRATWQARAASGNGAVELLPGWDVAHRRMQQDGRPSKVNHPSAAHLAYQIPQPAIVTKAVKAKGDDSTP